MTQHQFESHLAKIRHAKVKVYSFDIFDTVLVRDCGTPQGVFYRLQEGLKQNARSVPQELRERFCQFRVAAEKEAQETIKAEGCNIRDIYSVLERQFKLSKDICEDLIREEMRLELDSVRPVPRVIQLLESLRKEGKKVIFVSDMYLPADFIQQLLEKVGAYQEGDKIYVSNEHLMTKRTGRLFDIILEKEGCAPRQMVHIGDNQRADVASPQEKGIQNSYVSETQLTRYEKILCNASDTELDNVCFYEQLAGASRLARLGYTLSGSAGTLHKLGVDLAGPILLGYVAWILQEARKKNLKRLYFIARDGQILLEIAQRVKVAMKMDIDLRYLYGSRQAWVLASCQEIKEEQANWLLMRNPILSLNILANRLGIAPEIIQNEIEKSCGVSVGLDTHLDESDIEKLRSLLQKEPLSALILAQVKEQRTRTAGYFEQEGLLEDISFGVVDLGWKGSLQEAMKKILISAGQDPHKDLYGFYFGVTSSDQRVIIPNNHKAGYYFSPDIAQKTCPVNWEAMYILELFITADHGLTLSYSRQSQNAWEPVLKEKENKDALQWGLMHLRQGIYDFYDHLPAAILDNVGCLIDNKFKDCMTEMLTAIQARPELDEAVALGDYFLKRDVAETYAMRFAPSFKIFDVCRFVGALDKTLITHWFEGSRVRSPLLLRRLMRLSFLPILRKFCEISSAFFRKIRKVVQVFCKKGNKTEGVVFIQRSCGQFAGMEKGTMNLVRYIDDRKTRIIVAAHKGDYWKEFNKNVPHVNMVNFPFHDNERKLVKFIRAVMFLKSIRATKIIWLYNQIDDFPLSEIIAGWLFTKNNMYISHHNFPADTERFKKGMNNKPAVIQGILKLKRKIYFYMLHFLIRKATSVSEDVTKDLQVRWHVAPSKIVTCTRGVDTKIFYHDDESKQIMRNDLNCRNGEKMFLAVHRLGSDKRIDRLLGSFLLLSQNGFDGRLIIAGDGPLRGQYEKRVKENTILRDRVQFLGFREDVNKLMQGADYLLLASDREGQSNVIKEAMACGIIPVVTDAPGSKDVSSEVFVSERNVFDFYRKIREAVELSEEHLILIRKKLIEEVELRYALGPCSTKWLMSYDLPIKD
ncbi:MAG: glycosyltransferase [Candidatus Omnitrophica bacterium]|nr:glycosyltransferase [Candidatus Omnitrophota bacterium]